MDVKENAEVGRAERAVQTDCEPADAALPRTAQPIPDASARMLGFSDLAAYQWMNLPAWVYDGERFCHRWANLAGLRFWRADSLDELCARNYADTSASARSRIALSMQAHARGETTYERWTLYPRGVPTSILLQGTAIRLPDGRTGILFMAELAMQFEPTVVRGVEALNHAGVLVAVHSMDSGSALMRNRAAAEFFGQVRVEVGANDFVEMFEDQPLGRALLARVVAGEAVETKALLKPDTGTATWHLLGARSALDPVTGESIAQFHAVDISELMATQQSLELAREKAEAGVRAKATFMTTMNHEVRTPINGLLGALHVLKRSPLTPQQVRWLDTAIASGSALAALIGDVVALAEIDSGQWRPAQELLDLRAMVDIVVQPLRSEATRKGLELALDIASGVPEKIVGDVRCLRQILFNLVANAVKFTAQGSVRVGVMLDQAEAGRRCLRLVVSDTGSGIRAEDQEIIFRPFFQVDQSPTRQHGGCGLGLALVRNLVDRLGGYIELDSRPGVGSRFDIVVPIA